MDIRVASQCDNSPKHTSENSLSPECSFGLNGGCTFPNVTPFMEAPPCTGYAMVNGELFAGVAADFGTKHQQVVALWDHAPCAHLASGGVDASDGDASSVAALVFRTVS